MVRASLPLSVYGCRLLLVVVHRVNVPYVSFYSVGIDDSVVSTGFRVIIAISVVLRAFAGIRVSGVYTNHRM